jgi:hypothetical protein
VFPFFELKSLKRLFARNRLKKLVLEKFKRIAAPGLEYFGKFYPVVKVINRALSS